MIKRIVKKIYFTLKFHFSFLEFLLKKGLAKNNFECANKINNMEIVCYSCGRGEILKNLLKKLDIANLLISIGELKWKFKLLLIIN